VEHSPSISKDILLELGFVVRENTPGNPKIDTIKEQGAITIKKRDLNVPRSHRLQEFPIPARKNSVSMIIHAGSRDGRAGGLEAKKNRSWKLFRIENRIHINHIRKRAIGRSN